MLWHLGKTAVLSNWKKKEKAKPVMKVYQNSYQTSWLQYNLDKLNNAWPKSTGREPFFCFVDKVQKRLSKRLKSKHCNSWHRCLTKHWSKNCFQAFGRMKIDARHYWNEIEPSLEALMEKKSNVRNRSRSKVHKGGHTLAMVELTSSKLTLYVCGDWKDIAYHELLQSGHTPTTNY